MKQSKIQNIKIWSPLLNSLGKAIWRKKVDKDSVKKGTVIETKHFIVQCAYEYDNSWIDTDTSEITLSTTYSFLVEARLNDFSFPLFAIGYISYFL